MTIAEIEDFLESVHKQIRAVSPRILNVGAGTKITAGQDTGKECIRVYVAEKVPEDQLGPGEVVPKMWDGKYLTDVIALKPDGWVAGKTEMSELSPKEQKRRLGLIPPAEAPVKSPEAPTQSFEIDWTKDCTPVRNQGQCGSCTAFGTVDAWQDNLKILESQVLVLSPQMLFFCAGGTCGQGATPDMMLNYSTGTGVALEQDCPYVSGNGVDEACGYGLAQDWYLRGKMLKDWTSTTVTSLMKQWLQKAPIITTFNVQMSFMNYVSGVYKPGNPILDPFVGGHELEVAGCSDKGGYWILKNSWGTGWGMSGFVNFIYGADGIDSEMYTFTLSDQQPQPIPPGPGPGPAPANKCITQIETGIEEMMNGDITAGLEDIIAGIECLIQSGVIKLVDVLKLLNRKHAESEIKKLEAKIEEFKKML